MNIKTIVSVLKLPSVTMDHHISMPNQPGGFGGSNESVKETRRVSLEDIVQKKATQRFTHVQDLLKVQKYLGIKLQNDLNLSLYSDGIRTPGTDQKCTLVLVL